MHYLINTLVEKGGMLPNYALWGSLETCQRRVNFTILFFLIMKMREKTETINAISHHSIEGE